MFSDFTAQTQGPAMPEMVPAAPMPVGIAG